jgi:hypothetical protein
MGQEEEEEGARTIGTIYNREEKWNGTGGRGGGRNEWPKGIRLNGHPPATEGTQRRGDLLKRAK